MESAAQSIYCTAGLALSAVTTPAPTALVSLNRAVTSTSSRESMRLSIVDVLLLDFRVYYKTAKDSKCSIQ
jgi:hypothetical protein